MLRFNVFQQLSFKGENRNLCFSHIPSEQGQDCHFKLIKLIIINYNIIVDKIKLINRYILLNLLVFYLITNTRDCYHQILQTDQHLQLICRLNYIMIIWSNYIFSGFIEILWTIRCYIQSNSPSMYDLFYGYLKTNWAIHHFKYLFSLIYLPIKNWTKTIMTSFPTAMININ
jgi:hypothetical protein